MLSKDNIIKLIKTLLILCLVWLIFFVSRSLLIKSESNISIHIPIQTECYIKIDGRAIFEKGLTSLVTSENLNEISKLLNEQELSESGTNPKGINLQSDIVLFEFNMDSIEYYGIILNISDKNNFKTGVIDELSNNYGVRTIDNYAIIITPKRDSQKSESLNETVQKLTFSTKTELKKIEFETSDLILKILKPGTNGELIANIDNSSFTFNGEFDITKDDSTNSPYTTYFYGLKPDGFHVSMASIPAKINSLIDHNFDFDLPLFSSLSINHRSSDLTGQSLSSLAFDTDILMSFKDSTSAEQLLSPLISLGYIESLDSNSFIHAGTRHYYHFISSNQLYIGALQFQKEMVVKQTNQILVSGAPSHLTDIKGEGFARSLLSMIPEFNASEELFNSIDDVNITIKQRSNTTKFICVGNISVKENHSTYMEMIKLVLNLKS